MDAGQVRRSPFRRRSVRGPRFLIMRDHARPTLSRSPPDRFAARSAGATAAPVRLEEATIAQIHAAMKAGRLTCRALVDTYLRRIDAYDKNGPALNAIVDRQSRRARSRPTSSTGGSRSRPRRAAPLHPGDRQGQLRDDRAAERRRLALAQGVRVGQGRVPGQAHQGRRRDRARQVEHGGVRVQPVRDGELAAAGLHAQSVRARSRDRRLERRHRGGRRRQLRRHRSRQRHRQLDPRAVGAPGARRHPLDDGPDEPRGRRPAEPARRHRRADDAHGGGRGRGVPGGRRRGSRRSGDARRRADARSPTTRSRSCATDSRARASACCGRPTSATTTDPEDRRGLHGRGRGPETRRRDDRRSGARRARPTCAGRRAAARAAASSTTSTAISRRTAIACRCRRSRRSSARASSIRRSKRACSRRRTGRRTDPRRRRARRKRTIASAFRAAVAKTMDAAKLDAFVYPTWSNPPRLIGDLNTPHGDNSQVFSPTTGWPGDQRADGLHARHAAGGHDVLRPRLDEPTLIKLAYAYEQATRHRRPPASAPPLR